MTHSPLPAATHFTASRLDDALAMVRHSLGPDAVVLGSRRVTADDGSARFEVRAAAAGVLAPRLNSRSMLERMLDRNEVPATHVTELAAQLEAPPRTFAEAESALRKVLSGALRFGGPCMNARVIALAGPTGVGKTTTIAKLAARDALVAGMRVALISTDGYRIGGADQLERYSELMGVPFEVALDAGALRRALDRHQGADRIYIDTAGRAPRDHTAIVQLAAMLADARAHASVHLCFSAMSRGKELDAIVERHSVLAPAALLPTKVDEALFFGGVVTAALRSGLPLSYLTTGQRVPEDLEVASAELLAVALAGEEVRT